MFEESLQEKFKQIFKVKKVSFDAPGDMKEQECLFVEIEDSKNHVKDGKFRAVVTGNVVMTAQNDKLKFGFFSKAIRKAHKDLTKDLAFFDIEKNVVTFQNLVQRSFSFRYFFDSQFDPNIPTMESVDIEIDTEEQ